MISVQEALEALSDAVTSLVQEELQDDMNTDREWDAVRETGRDVALAAHDVTLAEVNELLPDEKSDMQDIQLPGLREALKKLGVESS